MFSGLETLLDEIAAELDVAMGRPERVSALAARVREALARPPTAGQLEALRGALPLLGKRIGPVVTALFELFEDVAAASPRPWALLEGLLAARDDALACRALDLAERLAASGALAVDRDVLLALADRTAAEGSPFAAPERLAAIARILRSPRGAGADPVRALFFEEPSGAVRRLAARLLDLDGEPASPDTAERLLGAGAHAKLDRYLRYTRAGHADLLDLLPAAGAPPPLLETLGSAEAACGEALLEEVIAELGWARVNLGLEVRRLVGLSVGGAVPYVLTPPEAALLESCGPARRTADVLLLAAHGGRPSKGEAAGAADPVARFKRYNLAHAEALADILDVAPLTREKAHRVVARMDRIVEDFVALFARHAEECAMLPGLWGDLRARISAELEKVTEAEPAPLSAELTRLVQSFEDPRNLGEVRTLHGLKRYLHQRGLKLGFKLIAAGGATNRTVDLVLATPGRPLRTERRISYVDFEPETPLGIPYAVRVVADAFARQLFHGHETFPSVQVFCYGDEVHYYLAYRNHPAFLRVDFAPPLLGGMIDLEYFAVSVYELSVHPDPTLDALVRLFRRLDLDVRLEGTHLHVRYDKERALDLGDVCAKAEALAGLIPFLMDLDWTLGSLALPAESRRAAGAAWAESFAEWGVLPWRELLTSDRQGILAGYESGPSGEREVAWAGEPPYRDRFRVAAPPGFVAGLREAACEFALEVDLPESPSGLLPGQIVLERGLLRPIREAIAGGRLIAARDGKQTLRAPPPEVCERCHEAEAFAELLASGRVAGAGRLARLVAPLERALRFRTTGRVNGYDVQRATLALRGESLGLYVLRDAGGLARLALWARGGVLCRRRNDASCARRESWSDDLPELSLLLRRNGYLPAGEAAPWSPEEEAETCALFHRSNAAPTPGALPGERILRGFRASPGRAVGTALFGTEGRTPEDFDGAVLVAPSVRPEDNTFLYHARGIVSTGGGILSHAGLIATQFRKPALIVAGEWRREPDGSPTLLYRTPEYREEARGCLGIPIAVFRDLTEREHLMREGDLLVLDAGAGALRVLGQDRDALALHDAFRLFAEASALLGRAADEREVLGLRGRRLRATHQARKIVSRLADPVLARYAAHELLLGERTELLALLLANRHVGEAARGHLLTLAGELRRRRDALAEESRRHVPGAATLFEVLAPRLEILRLGESLASARASLAGCGIDVPADEAFPDDDLLAAERLRRMRDARVRELSELVASPARDPRLRHLLRQVERLDGVLGAPEEDLVRRARARLAREDEAARRGLAGRRVLAAEECGFELHALVGWKAANLAEVARLAGGGLVPAWFAVTDRAFEEALATPLERPAVEGVAPGLPLDDAIAAILARRDLDNAGKAVRIRLLWEALELSPELCAEALAAYRALAGEGDDAEGPFVAVRSSACEEDAEIAARAGEFETFLFVRGETRLLEHVKRAWSGLWTERAIHNRAVLGLGAERAGGGVVVQRIVASRVAGVLQTVNVAEGEPREMVVNVGLGLGEGVVSGTVAADHVVVARTGGLASGALRFRYVTADKRERIVFDRRAGLGTARAECLYHQRLRPALEYVELCELVRTAARLEDAYGYPLDIEFGIEGSRLFVLQARPVPTFLSVLGETRERRPLVPEEAAAPALPGGSP